MTAERRGPRRRHRPIHQAYRRFLKRPALAAAEIERIRKHIIRLARTVCEHIWGRRFY